MGFLDSIVASNFLTELAGMLLLVAVVVCAGALNFALECLLAAEQ